MVNDDMMTPVSEIIVSLDHVVACLDDIRIEEVCTNASTRMLIKKNDTANSGPIFVYYLAELPSVMNNSGDARALSVPGGSS